MKKMDYVLMGIITFIYAVVGFYNLGDRQAPESFYEMKTGESIVIEFLEPNYISRVQYYSGPINKEIFFIEVLTEEGIWELFEAEGSRAFAWGETDIALVGFAAKITASNQELILGEIAFKNAENVLIPVVKTSFLTDEQNRVPLDNSYKNSTYFDEIYHARTAYEMLNGLRIYEWTHPPLGKVIISIGIKLLGMNPFGWRFSGTLIGVLMVPLIYLFAKAIFKDSFWAGFSAVIFAFDFMHFSQTRIATIDTYTVFFTIAMYYFMYRYIQLDFSKDSLLKTFVPLGLCGILLSFNIASKWQGVYAGIGLGVLFFINIFKRYRQVVKSDKNMKKFKKNFTCTIAFCLVFFIAVPVLIYFLSHFMYFNTPGYDNIGSIIELQKKMFSYHSDLESTHPYASKWYTWPLIIRPVFYYAKSYGDNIRAGISAMGNPLIWWTGIIAFLFTMIDYVKNRSKDSLFLVIGYLAQYMPWAVIARTTYMYHYFPSVPFVVLMITMMFKKGFGKIGYKAAFVYGTAVIVLFILFYPVLSGMPVNSNYVVQYLRWMPSWQLIIE